MEAFGFFRELGHGLPSGPSLEDARDPSMPSEERARLAGYLRSGHVVAATSALVDDVLDPSRTEVSTMNVVTDGHWVWPADLAYYVEQYGVTLPDALAARAHAGPPDVSDGEAAAALQFVMDGMPGA